MQSSVHNEVLDVAPASSSALSEFQIFLEGLLSSLDTRKIKRPESTLGIDNLDDKDDDEDEEDAEEHGSSQPDEGDPDVKSTDAPTSVSVPLLTSSELGKLQRQVSATIRKAEQGAASPSVLAQVPPLLLEPCLLHLDAHLAAGLRSHLVKAGLEVRARGGGIDSWLNNGAGKGLLQQLRDALQAASLLLCFLTADGINPKLVSEERVESCCALLKHLLQGQLVAVHNFSNNDAASAPAKGDKRNSSGGRGGRGGGRGGRGRGGGSGGRGGRGARAVSMELDSSEEGEEPLEGEDVEDGDDAEVSFGSLPNKSPKSGTPKSASAESKSFTESARPLQRAVLRLCETGGVADLMERLGTLVAKIKLDDRLVLTISAASLATLPVQCEVAELGRLLPVQHQSLGLLRHLIVNYENHRYLVFDDLFAIMLQLPTAKKFQRTFKLHHLSKQLSAAAFGFQTYADATTMDGQSDSVSVLSALVMLLVQAAVPDDAYAQDERTHPNAAETSLASPQPAASSALSGAHRAANYVVKQFCTRCQKKEEGSAWRPLMVSFVEDLLHACPLPDWPAAETLLQCLTGELTRDLTLYNNADSEGGSMKKFADSSAASESGYLGMALELLGKICARVRALVRRDREEPLVLPEELSPDAVDESAKPHEAGQVVGCPCGLAVGSGGFMLDCDRCHRWFHGPCVGVDEHNPPNQWFCEDCDLAVMVLRQRTALDRSRALRARLSLGYNPGKDQSSDEEEDKEDLVPLKLSPEKVKPKRGRPKKNAKDKEKPTTKSSLEVVAVTDRENSRADAVAAKAPAEDRAIFRQLLLNHLSVRAGNEVWIAGARQFHLARWLHDYAQDNKADEKKISNASQGRNGSSGAGKDSDDDDDANFGSEVNKSNGGSCAGLYSHFVDQWQLSHNNGATSSSSDWVVLDTSGTARVVRSLMVKGGFVGSFDQVLAAVLALLGGSSPTLRAKVVKAVAGIVDADPVLMANDQVKAAVVQRFYDASISVRQAAVDLVGRFALLTPDLFERYFEALAERLVDRGVSVRKAVVKILRDALLAHPNHPRRRAICQLLVSRASSPKEEDSIKDLVRRTFEVLWFDGRGDSAEHDYLVSQAQQAAAAQSQAASAFATRSSSGSLSPRTPRGAADSTDELDRPVEVQATNPKTPGTQGHARYEKYKAARTMREFLELGGSKTDLRNAREKGFLVVLDAPPSSNGDMFSCPPGWREERSSAGIAFVSPAGHRCLSAQEANDVARRTSLALQPSRSAVSPGSGGSGAVISPDSGSLHEPSELAASHFTPVETRVRAAASQIVEVVHGVSNSEWLVELLKGMLFGANDGSKAKKEAAKRRALVLARCQALVGCCVEFLLALDDDDAAASTFITLPTSPRVAAAAALLHENGDEAAAAAAALEAERAAKMVATLATLHVFCKASPSLLVVHVETLLPYLKADNRIGGPAQEAKVCALVANMVSWALPLMPSNRRDARLLATAAKDLQQLTYKFGGDVVHAAVECLAVLAKATPAPIDKLISKDSEEALLVLARTFYRVLRPRATIWPLQPQDLSKVGRGLVVLGAICRYRTATDYDDEYVEDNEDDDGDNENGRTDYHKGAKSNASAPSPLPLELTAHNLKNACYSCFLGYLRRDNEQVSRTALRGLSSQLIGSPRLMLRADRDGVVAAALTHASPALRLEALVGWRDILQAEELRVESGLAGKQMESRLNGGSNGSSSEEEDDGDEDYGTEQNGGKGVRFSADRSASAGGSGGGAAIKRKVQGDQDSESSVVGGVLQLHVGTVLGLLFDKSKLGSSIRNAATSLLGVMLRQGLVNPLQVLPYVVALLGDPSPELRGDALRLLLVEDEKRPEFLKQRLLQGIALAYRLQTQVIGRPVPLLQDEGDASTGGLGSSIFAGVYSQCLRSSRPKRQGLLTGMVKLFDAKRAGDVESWLATGNGAGAVTSPNSASSNGGELMDFKASSKRLNDGSDARNKGSESGEGAAELDLGFLTFVAQTLCNLPYDVQEEPLFVVHLVSRFVAYEGSALLAAFKQKLRAEGFAADAGLAANEDDDSDDEGLGEDKDSDSSDADEDLVTLKLSPKKPRGRPPSAKPSTVASSSSSAKASSSSSSTNGPSKNLLKLAASSVAVGLLLRVKHFLKEVYKLASAKCAEYTPSEGTKSMERALHRPEWPLPQLAGLPDAHCLSRFGAGRAQRYGDGDLARPGDTEAVCAQFSAFRRLMRQDPADFKLSTTKSPRSAGGVNKAGKKRVKGSAGMDGEGEGDDEPAVIRGAKAANNGAKKAKKAPLKKKKKMAVGSDDSGDDSDDEDYR